MISALLLRYALLLFVGGLFTGGVNAGWSINIDCGGTGLTDGNVTWIADTYSSDGSTANNQMQPISGTVASSLRVFQTERTWVSSITYRVPVPEPGIYSVTLYLVEFYWTWVGARLFSVDIQGVRVLQNFDIFQAAAGKNKLITRTFTATVVSSPYTVTIAGQSTRDNPSFTALAIVQLSSPSPQPPTSSTPAPIPPSPSRTLVPPSPSRTPTRPSPSDTLVPTSPSRTPVFPSPSSTLIPATPTPSQRVSTPLSVPPPVPPPAPHYTPVFPNILRAGAVVGATYTVSSTVRILMPPDCTCQFQLASTPDKVNDVFVVTTGLSPSLFDNSKICGQCLSIYDPVSGRTGVTLAADYLVGQNIQQNQLDIAEDLARYFLDGRIDNFNTLLVTPVMCDWVSYRPEWFLDRGSYGQNVYIQPRYYSRLITAITILGPDGTYNLVQDGYGRWTGAVATRWNPSARWYQFRLSGQGTTEVVEDEFYWDGPPPSGMLPPQIILATRSQKNWAPR